MDVAPGRSGYEIIIFARAIFYCPGTRAERPEADGEEGQLIGAVADRNDCRSVPHDVAHIKLFSVDIVDDILLGLRLVRDESLVIQRANYVDLIVFGWIIGVSPLVDVHDVVGVVNSKSANIQRES